MNSAEWSNWAWVAYFVFLGVSAFCFGWLTFNLGWSK